MTGRYLLELICDLFFPPRCHVCGDVCEFCRHGICSNCADSLTLIERGDLCSVCGKPFSSCVCSDEPFAFSRCISALIYNEELMRAVETLKKQPSSYIARDFTRHMTDMLKKQEQNLCFDFVTCVPMQQSKQQKRGHNQAETLAKLVSQKLALRYLSPTLLRIENSHAQHKLSAALRVKNARASFIAEDCTVSGRILLIDDVATTLSTLNRCAELLRSQGANEVVCLTAATTLLHFKK